MSLMDTIRLLIINDDAAEVDRLLSMLRNAGLALRAQHAPSPEGLEKLLNDQAWDLLLAVEGATSCDAKVALRLIKKLDKDIPTLLLTEADIEQRGRALIDGLKAGARDVLALDDDQHLLLAITRELGNLQERRERRSADRKLKESERRCQQLLDSSRDAIAYVEDGTFLYANQSFADCFAYASADDIVAIPVIDLVASKDQETYKRFMKAFKLSESGTQEMSLHGARRDKKEFQVAIAVTHALYENDACVQLRVAGGSSNAVAEQKTKKTSVLDIMTGVYSRAYMASALNSAINDASERDQYSSMHIIHIDVYEELRSQLGTSGRDAAVADFAAHLKSLVGREGTLGRIADDEFALLTKGIDEEQQTQRANQLCKQVSGHIYKTSDKTTHIAISIGICPITEKITTSDQVLERAHVACVEARALGKKGGGSAAKYHVLKLGDSSSSNIPLVLEVIERTLGTNGFKLQFQPIVNLRGDVSEFYEALLVMPPDENGVVMDTDEAFKILQHDDELGKKVDRWTLLNVTKLLAKHRETTGQNTRMAINLTAASLKDDGLAAWLAVALKMASLPAEAIILQVSEADIASHINHAITFCAAIRTLGSQACIKHFGCALDSFKVLGHLDIDLVKIDGSFTQDIQKKNETPDTLNALIAEVNNTGKQTIVPFVENATVLSTLWQAGAHFIQGHYVQAPSDKMDFIFADE